jgi:TonB-linked SusC/RagA family outer membrane protein
MKLNFNAIRFRIRKRQLLNLMRMFIILFGTTIYGFTTNISFSQTKITIDKDQYVTVNQVFRIVKKQTDYAFIIPKKIVKNLTKINLKKGEIELDQLLNQTLVLNNLNYELSDDKTIYVRENLPVSNYDTPMQQSQINGVVKDSDGNPLPGASVIESGTDNGTTTDFDGNFVLSVSQENPTLEISFIGFISQIVMADANSNFSVMLMADIAGLEEIVLTGYGSQNKRDITSSISVLDLDGVAEKANTDVGLLLQGRSSGVRVVQNSGKPGAGPQIFIRGISSLSGNTQPLYVIDGVVSYSTAALDPNNIEDITVLKDASAAGIYGAAGASNGVVLITTKKGKSGSIKATLNTYTGSAQLINKIPLLNPSQLDEYINELNGTSITYSGGINNDWQDLLYQTAMQSGINASVSGGSEKGSFYVGLGYLNREGIVVTTENKRYSLSFSMDQEINDWLSFGTHFNYTRSNVKEIPDQRGARYGGAISSALQTPPFQEIFDANGFYSVSAAGSGFGNENPLSHVYSNDNLNVINSMVADANFSVKLPYSLTYKSQIGIILTGNRYTSFRDPTLNQQSNSYGGSGQHNTGEVSRYVFDNTLTYSEEFGIHKLNVVIGNSISDENSITSEQENRNFASETVRTLNTATTFFESNTKAGSWSLASYFTRANYTYDDKYSATASFRTDGSSRIASDNRWGTFKTFSAGWNLSNESFMQDVEVVKNLKFRVGYGETGNLPSGLNSYANIVQVQQYPSNATDLAPGRMPSSQAGNKDLKWETSAQTNIGIDFSILNDRVYVSTDYYVKETKDMIFPTTLPQSSGFKTKIVNLDGLIENKGFEFAINANVIEKSDFSWNSIFNMSFNKNNVLGIPEDQIIFSTALQNLGGSVTITKNGLPIGSFYGLNAEGVDPATGDMIFTDNDDVDGITPEDRQVIGNPMPDFTYGFVNEFSYKNFDLNVVIDGSYGNEIYNAGKQNLESMRFAENQSADIVRRWRNPGDITDIPRATIVDPNENSFINTRWVEDGSFMRIRDISLSYNFDQSILDKLRLSGLRVYGNLKNWFTFTDYTGYSPEVNRNIIGLDDVATTQGIDYGSYPQAKTFSIGLNIEF